MGARQSSCTTSSNVTPASAGASTADRSAPRGPQVVHLVPEAPGGIRDYAENIRRVWSRSGIECRILALAQRAVATSPLWSQLDEPQARGTGAICLVVHYSGYGYSSRGLCGWLNQQLADAREHFGPRLRIVVMFHELYASGPPWRSAFWLQGRQERIAAQLANLSDVTMTNTGVHARWLEQHLGHGRSVTVWPVFSNVGEPLSLAPHGARPRRLVVFGSESTRKRALQQVHRHSSQLADLGIDELVEVGAGRGVGAWPPPLRASFAGRLEESALGDLLAQSAFGLIEYPLHCMGKSTVFAAYAAHGCVILNAGTSREAADGLTPGEHFLSLDPRRRGVPNAEELRRIALNAKGWYDQHTLAVQTAALAETCGLGPSAAGPPASED